MVLLLRRPPTANADGRPRNTAAGRSGRRWSGAALRRLCHTPGQDARLRRGRVPDGAAATSLKSVAVPQRGRGPALWRGRRRRQRRRRRRRDKVVSQSDRLLQLPHRRPGSAGPGAVLRQGRLPVQGLRRFHHRRDDPVEPPLGGARAPEPPSLAGPRQDLLRLRRRRPGLERRRRRPPMLHPRLGRRRRGQSDVGADERRLRATLRRLDAQVGAEDWHRDSWQHFKRHLLRRRRLRGGPRRGHVRQGRRSRGRRDIRTAAHV
mmetsp:Transcript_13539/g.48124  ORF Transcript_13539/g.48124 Transcript_13539/m.48124 type:complete len:263 (-) Transcript_13539:1664-2452(-)